MQTAAPVESTCCGCHFSPLCFANTCQNSFANSAILPIKRRIVLQKKEVLFTPNSAFQFLFAIEKGAIKTVQLETDGSELIRGFYFSGEILGYKAIYTGRYQSTAKALSETHVCVIDYRDFLYFLQSNPKLHQHIMHLISLQMNAGSYLVSTSADRKLAAFLLDLSIRLNSPSSQSEIHLPMSRQDIGNYLRLTAETISRISSRLVQNKIIAVDNKKITLLNKDALRKVADGIIMIDESVPSNEFLL